MDALPVVLGAPDVIRDRSTGCVFYRRVLYLAKSTGRPFGAPVSCEKPSPSHPHARHPNVRSVAFKGGDHELCQGTAGHLPTHLQRRRRRAVGIFVYFLVGFVTGYAPEIKIRRFRTRRQISNRQLWLNQAGVAVTPRQYWAGSILVGVGAFLAVSIFTGAPLVALVPAIGVAALPGAYFARRRTAHLRRVQAAWPDGLRDIIASIAAGRSLAQALNSLAVSGPAPLQAFARFPLLARMLGTVPALEVVKEELADPTTVSSHTLQLGHETERIGADPCRSATLMTRRSVRRYVRSCAARNAE